MIAYLRVPLLAEPRPVEWYPAQPCCICGRPWVPWAHSRLPCHGRCLLNEAGVARVLERFRDPAVNHQAIADELGVPVGVVKATLHANGVRMR